VQSKLKYLSLRPSINQYSNKPWLIESPTKRILNLKCQTLIVTMARRAHTNQLRELETFWKLPLNSPNAVVSVMPRTLRVQQICSYASFKRIAVPTAIKCQNHLLWPLPAPMLPMNTQYPRMITLKWCPNNAASRNNSSQTKSKTQVTRSSSVWRDQLRNQLVS
jgi:hypothetical protein